MYLQFRTATSHLEAAVSLTTRACHTARPTTMPNEAPSVLAARSQSPGDASQPWERSSTPNISCVPSAWNSLTKGHLKNKMTNPIVTPVLWNSSADGDTFSTIDNLCRLLLWYIHELYCIFYMTYLYIFISIWKSLFLHNSITINSHQQFSFAY